MTPAARLQAAIDVLSHWYGGAAIEKALTNWARGARYAGSKDRAGVRDIVFDCLRKRMYFQKQYSLPDNGRGIVIAHAMSQGANIVALFADEGYGPTALSPEETRQAATVPTKLTPSLLYECPDWMVEEFTKSLGQDAERVVKTLRDRARVFLRVNTIKADVAAAQKALADEDIETATHSLSPTALEVLSNPRRVSTSKAFEGGLVELQDAASQAVVDLLQLDPVKPMKVLDYCAGGGGKSLALAASIQGQVIATDIDAKRMKDIPSRARRAGASVLPVEMNKVAEHGLFDLVFCDAPCTGSGAWRRAPEGRWRLTHERAVYIAEMQRDVLQKASRLVGPNGGLAYATCSVFNSENVAQVDWFLKENPGWAIAFDRQFSPLEGGDGFYIAYLTRI